MPEGGAVEGGAERDAARDVTDDGGGHPTCPLVIQLLVLVHPDLGKSGRVPPHHFHTSLVAPGVGRSASEKQIDTSDQIY